MVTPVIQNCEHANNQSASDQPSRKRLQQLSIRIDPGEFSFVTEHALPVSIGIAPTSIQALIHGYEILEAGKRKCGRYSDD